MIGATGETTTTPGEEPSMRLADAAPKRSEMVVAKQTLMDKLMRGEGAFVTCAAPAAHPCPQRHAMF